MTKPPDAQNFFGTDQVGRDTLSRVIYGARTSLFVAFSAVLLGTTVGSVWGLACGYLRGRFDLVSQRIMEILQSFPDLILAMAISMAIGTGLPAVIIAVLAFNLLGDGIRDTLDPRLSPAFLRLVTGSGRTQPVAAAPTETPAPSLTISGVRP